MKSSLGRPGRSSKRCGKDANQKKSLNEFAAQTVRLYCEQRGGDSMGRRKLKIEGTPALLSDVEKYYAAHPSGAAALRHPRIAIDRGRYVAYTGRSIKRGVIGFGTSIGSALSAFDHLYAKILGTRIR
jgi:hypothetical protein